MQQIEHIRPKLNLHATPTVKNLFPAEVKKYLERNKLKFCVLVVEAKTVKGAYENLPKQRDEYEELLKTAVDRVGKISSKRNARNAVTLIPECSFLRFVIL